MEVGAEPTEEDVLRSQEPTITPVTSTLQVPGSGAEFSLVDIGALAPKSTGLAGLIYEDVAEGKEETNADSAVLTQSHDAVLLFANVAFPDSVESMAETQDQLKKAVAAHGGKPLPVFVVFNKHDILDSQFQSDDEVDEKTQLEQVRPHRLCVCYA